jgi:hypothetical protein
MLKCNCTSRTDQAGALSRQGVGLRQNPGQPQRPLALAFVFGDQILADFDERVRNIAALAVHRDGVIGCVADEIRRVVADVELRSG